MHLGGFPTAQYCIQSPNFMCTQADSRVHFMSVQGLESIPTFDAAKQILPTTEVIVVGGVGFEKEIGRVVSCIRNLLAQVEKMFFVHFCLPHASTLLDSSLGYHSLLPVQCQVNKRADRTIELVNGDRRELFINEITPESLESKFSQLFRFLSLGTPGQHTGKFMFASLAMDGKMFVVQTHVSWYNKFARYMAITPPPPESGVLPRIT